MAEWANLNRDLLKPNTNRQMYSAGFLGEVDIVEDVIEKVIVIIKLIIENGVVEDVS